MRRLEQRSMIKPTDAWCGYGRKRESPASVRCSSSAPWGSPMTRRRPRGSYEPMLIKHSPLHYLKMVYLDTVCYHLPAARCIVETVGPDRVIFGTDAPPLTTIKGRGIQMVRDLKLSPEDEEKVFSGNAQKASQIVLIPSGPAAATWSSGRPRHRMPPHRDRSPCRANRSRARSRSGLIFEANIPLLN
jgi:hypothetical protein